MTIHYIEILHSQHYNIIITINDNMEYHFFVDQERPPLALLRTPCRPPLLP